MRPLEKAMHQPHRANTHEYNTGARHCQMQTHSADLTVVLLGSILASEPSVLNLNFFSP